jgi:adenylate kinase family enzyme
MKIMIFGDPASWKSTFAEKLSKLYQIKANHTDLLRVKKDNTLANNNIVNDWINKFLEAKERIIEGNALRADPKKRIEQADIIYFLIS